MGKDIWYLEQLDFYEILCPYKLEDHINKNPSSVYRKHEFLFMEDELAREILLIDRGKVKVGNYDEHGNETIVAYLGKGEILGETALLGEQHHHTFAQVMENGTQVCKISVNRAKELTRDYVPFALEMNRRISGRIIKLQRRIEILLRKSVRTRLIEFFKDLATDHGEERGAGVWIEHTLTQSDIASLIGTSRKSASLTMNELASEGLIAFGSKHIHIIDIDELNRALLGVA